MPLNVAWHGRKQGCDCACACVLDCVGDNRYHKVSAVRDILNNASASAAPSPAQPIESVQVGFPGGDSAYLQG